MKRAAILMFLMLTAITALVSASENEVYFYPQDSKVSFDEVVKVEIWINATEIQGGQINLTYHPNCVNVTDWQRNTTNFQIGGWLHYNGREWITFSTMDPQPPLLTGNYNIGTLSIHCVNESKECCKTTLAFVDPSTLLDDRGNPVPATWTDGIFRLNTTCEVRGDFNGNGRVDIGDATYVAYMVVGKVPVDLSADFNNNNRVDIGDATKIAYYVVGKISEL